MLTFLKTAAAVFVMFLLVPLVVLCATGSWRHAVHAFKRYLVAMSVLAAMGAGVGVLMILAGMLG